MQVAASPCLPRRGLLCPFYQSNIDRFLLSVAGRLPRSLGMRTGGWDDATVDARMIIGVEPSRALGAVIGTITETSTLRHCGRGRAQQQRHCHDRFCCAHSQIPLRLGSIAPCGCCCLTVRFLVGGKASPRAFTVLRRHIGIRHTEAVVIHGLFALVVRRVIAVQQAALGTPGI